MICLDTNFIIDFLKKKKEAVGFIEKCEEEVVTTEINSFEVFIGIYGKEDYGNKSISARGFFDSIKILSGNQWGEEAAKILADLIKEGKIIEVNDCLMISIMKANGCNRIVTNNRKHFERIKNIEIISY